MAVFFFSLFEAKSKTNSSDVCIRHFDRTACYTLIKSNVHIAKLYRQSTQIVLPLVKERDVVKNDNYEDV